MADYCVKMPYRLVNKYPGMSINDEVIWDSFVMQNPHAFKSVMYHVPVGRPTDDPREEIQMKKSGAWDVGVWRVDVLADDGEKDYVIELKPSAKAGALGQVLAYKKLLAESGVIGEDAVPLVITDNISPITQRAAELLGVILIVA